MTESWKYFAEADEEFRGYDNYSAEKCSLQLSDLDDFYSKKRTVLETYPGNASNFVSHNELYEDSWINHNGTDVSYLRSGTSVGNEDDDSLMVQYSVAHKADQSTLNLWKDQYQSVTDINSTVNISVNVKIVQKSDAKAEKLSSQQIKEYKNHITVGNKNAISAADGQRNSEGTLTHCLITEDAFKDQGQYSLAMFILLLTRIVFLDTSTSFGMFQK